MQRLIFCCSVSTQDQIWITNFEHLILIIRLCERFFGGKLNAKRSFIELLWAQTMTWWDLNKDRTSSNCLKVLLRLRKYFSLNATYVKGAQKWLTMSSFLAYTLEFKSELTGLTPLLKRLSITRPSENRSDLGDAHLLSSHSAAAKFRSGCVIFGSLLVNGMAWMGFWKARVSESKVCAS